MALIRWEPARELRTARSDFDRLFGSVFDTTTFAAAARPAPRRFTPALDIVEGEREFLIKADLPGLSDDDVQLEVEDGVLTISGERKHEPTEKQDGYLRLERSTGSFQRALSLPEGIDPATVAARFERGVLEIRVPKPEERTARKIAIAVGDAETTREVPSET